MTQESWIQEFAELYKYDKDEDMDIIRDLVRSRMKESDLDVEWYVFIN